MKKMMLVLSFFVAGQVIAGVDERLLEAAKAGDLAGVNRALAAGANVNANNDDGKTALILAAWNGFDEMVKRLIEAGANVNAANSFGDTALLWAAFHGIDEMVRRLIEAGANVNAKNNHGDRALKEAAYHRRDQIAKDLLVAGADIPDGLRKKEIDWLDRVITEINEEKALERLAYAAIFGYECRPNTGIACTTNALLSGDSIPLASEVIAAKNLQRFGRGMQNRIASVKKR